MGTRVVHCLIFFILGLALFSDSSAAEKPLAGAIKHNKKLDYEEKQKLFPSSKFITQLDVTTPIINPTTPTTTIPVINPITNPTPPTTMNPITNPTPPTTMNPITTPTAPTTMNPITPTPPTTTNPITTPTAPTTMNPITPPTTTPPVSSGGIWCVASSTASQTALQVALDYACGYGGADCSAIQPSGSCYNPNTLRDHASYAFNEYYHKNPAPTSCDFGGTAMVSNIDPSSGSCQYASTSSSSSVVNSTNPSPSNPSPSGPTTYGSGPTGSINSAVSISCSFPLFFISTCLPVAFIAVNCL